MMWRDGEVKQIRKMWGSKPKRCGELEVEITGSPIGAETFLPGTRCKAIIYEQLCGIPEINERVRLEVSALDKNLGTGGHALISTRLDVLPEQNKSAGHLVKVRYMPEQVMVCGADEQNTASHELLSAPGNAGLAHMPVVVADLHSSLPAILAGLNASALLANLEVKTSAVRAAYIMTDGGALPIAYSRTVAALSDAGLLAGTVTCGQAWGGDLEAVSLYNALLMAKHVLHAQVAIVIQGPGNLGTDTPWGFSGVSCGEAINAINILGGTAVACLRISQADLRLRHRGISHHCLTAYGIVALTSAQIAVPNLPGAFGSQIRAQARQLCAPRPQAQTHKYVEINTAGLYKALQVVELKTGVRLSTMGRNLDDDPAAFISAAAAGKHAAALLDI